ncbi:putative glycosyl transferase [compost metagenome]
MEVSQAGLVVRSGDAAALAQAVKTMAGAGNSERKEMGLRGRTYAAEHFDRAMLISRLETWLADLKL